MPADIRPELQAIILQLEHLNDTTEAILAKLHQVIHVKVVTANAPPQYTGPTEFIDGVVGGTQDIAQYGFDPDGDPLTYSVVANPLATMTPSGILQYTAAGEQDIEIVIDDGKP